MKSLILAITFSLLTSGCEQSASSTESHPTWFTDIRPLMNTYCTRCHSPQGAGPGDFSSLTEVELKADVMLHYMLAGEMPPGASDPTCRNYIGSDHMVLSEQDTTLFKRWIEVGKPQGSIANAPPLEAKTLELKNPNLELRIQEPYAPQFLDPNNIGNEYRCFALSHNQRETFYITALHPIVDQPHLVHHIVLFKSSSSLPDAYYSPTGADCIDNMISNQVDGMIAGWAPGMHPIEFDEGLGIPVNPNESIFIQMHYFQNPKEGRPMVDQSGYAFRITPEPQNPVLMIPFGPEDFRIPAGDEEYSYSQTQDWGNNFPSVVLHGIFPHMHQLGSGYRMWVNRDSQETCLLESKNFHFDNQQTYMFAEPFEIRPGDKITFKCTWNNSVTNPKLVHTPPIDVFYGERTDEEMCFAFILGSISSF